MSKKPSEVFGIPISHTSPADISARRSYQCPFMAARCDKQSRLLKYPMGVCAVHYGNESIALCPRRFLQENIPFRDIAQDVFGGVNDLILFSEVGLPKFGNFDFILAKHKALSSNIEDFVIVEFQTGQTTGTGALVTALDEFMKGKDISSNSYNFGMNMADIWKRTFTQILIKGLVAECWNVKIYWVIQDLIYRDFVTRYSLDTLSLDRNHCTVFFTYDLKEEEDGYRMIHKRAESATIDSLLKAFRTRKAIPPKEEFMAQLKAKHEAKAFRSLRLDVTKNR